MRAERVGGSPGFAVIKAGRGNGKGNRAFLVPTEVDIVVGIVAAVPPSQPTSTISLFVAVFSTEWGFVCLELPKPPLRIAPGWHDGMFLTNGEVAQPLRGDPV